MPRAYISIGSNIAPAAHVRAALELLAGSFGPLLCSGVYRTPAVGFEGEDFLNMVVGIDTHLSPTALASGNGPLLSAGATVESGPVCAPSLPAASPAG